MGKDTWSNGNGKMGWTEGAGCSNGVLGERLDYIALVGESGESVRSTETQRSREKRVASPLLKHTAELLRVAWSSSQRMRYAASLVDQQGLVMKSCMRMSSHLIEVAKFIIHQRQRCQVPSKLQDQIFPNYKNISDRSRSLSLLLALVLYRQRILPRRPGKNAKLSSPPFSTLQKEPVGGIISELASYIADERTQSCMQRLIR